MKNERTPRTLSECEFTTGYRDAQLLKRSGAAADFVVILIAAVVVACFYFKVF
jgi:hypothetical protein